jgi:hypothetical protein
LPIKDTILYLNVGSNDVADPACRPSQLACALRLYSRRYAERKRVQVVIGQLHKRRKQPHPHFNDRVDEVNR